MSDRVPKTHLSMVVQQPISRKGACLVLIERKECSIWVHSTAISRSTIDRERWQINKNKISEKQNIKKKGYDQATGRTRVNIGAAFQRWREQKEWKGIYSYSCVVSFWWMSNIDFALFHTTYPCWLSLEYAVVSPLLVSAIVVAMVLYACVDVEYFFQFHIHFRNKPPQPSPADILVISIASSHVTFPCLLTTPDLYITSLIYKYILYIFCLFFL